MSVENKKDNLTTKSITRSQAKNNPKLAEIIEDNRKKAFEIKKKTAENQDSKNPNTPSNTSASTSQKLELSGNPNQDTSIIISSSIPPKDRSALTDSILFDKSIFDTSNLTGNSTIVDKFDRTLIPTNTSNYKEQLHLSESSEDSDRELNYKSPEKLAEDPEKSISNDPQLLEPLIKQYKEEYSPISNKMTTNNPQIITVAHNQVVSLRDALEVVPIFTGDNISLDQFIEGCREAKDMLPAGAESNLTKLIKTKVKGEARKCVSGGQYRSVEDIIDSLKRVYSLNKSVYQLQGELGNIYQWDSEKVISYATRVRELGEKILDAHKANNNDRIDANFQAALDSDIRDCFLRGLKTEIESRLQGVHNFKDTVNNALEIERKISATAALRSARTPYRQKEDNLIGPSEKRDRNRINITQEEIFCQICGRRGHTAPTCRQWNQITSNRQGYSNNYGRKLQPIRNPPYNENFYNRNNQRQPFNRGPQPNVSQWTPRQENPGQWRPQSSAPNQSSWQQQTTSNFNRNREFQNASANYPKINNNKNCNYCKKIGHTIDECRRRAYNESLKKQQQPNRAEKQNQGNSRPLPDQGAMREAI